MNVVSNFPYSYVLMHNLVNVVQRKVHNNIHEVCCALVTSQMCRLVGATCTS